MTLAEEMFNKYAPKGDASIRKNIEIALEDIRDAMRQGKDNCELWKDWTDLPDDWVVMPETLDYLRENGFVVEDKETDSSWPQRYALVSWPDANKIEFKNYG